MQRLILSRTAGVGTPEVIRVTAMPDRRVARALIPGLRVYDDAAPEGVEEETQEIPSESSGRLQRSATAPSPEPLGPQIERSLDQARSTGSRPLPREARSTMEARLGYDLGGVRIHTSAEAGELARGLRARAFTLGNDVFFAPGEYRTGTRSGLHLLAHELTHVVQQRGGEHGAQRIQRSEADTLALCPLYWRWETPRLPEFFNCAGLAFRTYDNRGNLAAERSAVAAGRRIASSTHCAAGEVKHWFWEYDMHADVPGVGPGSPRRDFHTVAGVTDSHGNDPDDVYSKNGGRPVYGPGTGPSFRPPARERDTSNDRYETPSTFQGHPVYKVRTNMSESCACFPCPRP